MREILKGSTDQSCIIRIIDATDGTPETGVVAATSGLDLKYRRELEATADLTESDLAALTTAHADGGLKHIGAGYYRVDLPDAAVATGANGVLVFGVCTGMVVIGCYMPLVNWNPYDGVRAGLTALPNAAAEAAGGLYTRGTGAGQINQPANGRIDTNSIALAGTTLTGRDIGASVLLSPGTGAGQLDFTSGVVKANLVQILGTALTETAGLIAAGFKKFFNVASPTGTVNSIPDAVAGAASGLALVGSNVGVASSVSGAVGSVTGNVGGNVTGTVGGFTSVAKAEIQVEAEDALLAHNLDHLVKVAVDTDFATTVHLNSVIGHLADNGTSATFDRTTDSLEAVYNKAVDVETDTQNLQGRVPAALVSGRIDASVGAMADDVLTATAIAADAITDAKVASDVTIASVTGAVGSVTGNVGGNVVGSVASVTAGVTLAASAVQAIWDAATSALTTVGSIGKRIVDFLTGDSFVRLGAPAGASIAADLAAIEAQTDDIGAAGAGLTAVPWNAAWDADVQSEVQDAIEVNHLDHLLAADYDPASKPGVATALLNELVESDAGVSRYTANTLEQAPSGTGASAASIRAEIDANSTQLAAIVADTNELQTDWANGGRLDLLLDSASSAGDPWGTAIPGAYGAGTAGKILGDNLNVTVSSRASQAALDTVDDLLDTEVAAIKAKTDNLPSDPADASDVAGSFSTVNSTLATIASYLDTEIAAVKAKTDQLTFTTAGKVDATLQAAADLAQAAADKVWSTAARTLTAFGFSVTVGTNSDKVGYALTSAYDPAKTAAQAGDAMALTAGERTSTATAVWASATRTLSSFGTLAADVWASVTRLLTAGTNIVLAKGTGVTGFNDLSAAEVNAEVDTALVDVGLTTTITGRIDAAVSTRATPAQVNTEADSAIADALPAIADAMFDEPIAGHATADTYGDKFGAHLKAVLKVVVGAGSTTTAVVLNATTGIDGGVPSNVNDFYSGRVLIFTSGDLAGQATSAPSYDGPSKTLTVVAMTSAPSAGDTAVLV